MWRSHGNVRTRIGSTGRGCSSNEIFFDERSGVSQHFLMLAGGVNLMPRSASWSASWRAWVATSLAISVWRAKAAARVASSWESFDALVASTASKAAGVDSRCFSAASMAPMAQAAAKAATQCASSTNTRAESVIACSEAENQQSSKSGLIRLYSWVFHVAFFDCESRN